MIYEDLLKEIYKEGIEYYENDYIGKLKGLYVDNTITLNTNIETGIEKRCILAEELGHHYTSYGDILDQSKLENRKQERKARAWAYKKLVSIDSLINAFEYGCRNRYELAEYLNVTERFIEEAITYYKEKYGPYYELNNYMIYFEPLGIMKKL